MEKDVPRRLGTAGSYDVEQGGDHGMTDHVGVKLLPNVPCRTGGNKSKSKSKPLVTFYLCRVAYRAEKVLWCSA